MDILRGSNGVGEDPRAPPLGAAPGERAGPLMESWFMGCVLEHFNIEIIY